MRRARKARAPRPNPHELMPPEGVPISLEVAAIGTRIAAQLTDLVVTFIGSVALVILLVVLKVTDPDTIFALAAFLFFAIRVPYYIVSELLWNGRTLGKRLMAIKVVAEDGGTLTAHALVARNLMKEAEIFLPATLVFTLDSASPLASILTTLWILATLVVPLANPRRRRLGDMIAGTYVVRLPVPILLSDVSRGPVPVRQAAGQGFSFYPHQLDHYGVYELQTLEALLRAGERPKGGAAAAKNHAESLAAVIEKIRLKIGYPDPVPEAERQAFLKAFYNAQRAHLEQRQLLGERRENKFHASAEPAAAPDATPAPATEKT
ncbi:MAG: RDD family protein [Maritimibacter sp.]|nr:RDD family protein [Maritimibacter sp.]